MPLSEDVRTERLLPQRRHLASSSDKGIFTTELQHRVDPCGCRVLKGQSKWGTKGFHLAGRLAQHPAMLSTCSGTLVPGLYAALSACCKMYPSPGVSAGRFRSCGTEIGRIWKRVPVHRHGLVGLSARGYATRKHPEEILMGDISTRALFTSIACSDRGGASSNALVRRSNLRACR